MMGMKRFFLIGTLCVAVVSNATAAFTLTATKVQVQDMTVDKSNFFVTVEAGTSTGKYELAFDIWPNKHSAIGTFSAEDKTIAYVSSYVHKTEANGKAVDMWYTCNSDAVISLTIISDGNGTCTLSGSIQAARLGTTYTYSIRPFNFEYEEDGVIEPEKDPYRFEPTEPTTFDFIADVVSFRHRGTYIEVTLNEMANETYDWIELRLLSDTLAMPSGTYRIDDSGEVGSLTASQGYLGGTKGDDPCYVAIRADKEDWGQYTPYYLVSGSLEVSLNAKGDTIDIAGTVHSYNGSTIHVHARSHNMLYVEEEQPKEPENVILPVDTVTITYLSNLSDSINNKFVYTFNFSKGDDYPTVLFDVVLSKPMELVAGTYTMESGLLSGLQLAQNQNDFEMNLFYGSAYDFTAATFTLTQGANGVWTYALEMSDAIGSEYRFTMSQTPHIVLYPQPVDKEEDRVYSSESKTITTQTMVLDTLLWKDQTVAKDGIIDIIMTCKNSQGGVRPYVHLGMYADDAKPAAGTYPVNGTEQSGSFSVSLGMYGSVLIPCYAAIVTDEGFTQSIWFLVDGTVSLTYNGAGKPILEGECTSYFGSTIRFRYNDVIQGLEKVQRNDVRSTKILRNGQLYILYKGTIYNVLGAPCAKQS